VSARYGEVVGPDGGRTCAFEMVYDKERKDQGVEKLRLSLSLLLSQYRRLMTSFNMWSFNMWSSRQHKQGPLVQPSHRLLPRKPFLSQVWQKGNNHEQ
jgi:hypothetical protein